MYFFLCWIIELLTLNFQILELGSHIFLKIIIFLNVQSDFIVPFFPLWYILMFTIIEIETA